MAELIYGFASYAMPPLVSMGCILIVFLIAPRLRIFWRALVASLLGSVVTVGPGLLYNFSEGTESEANPVIYFAVFWVPTLMVSWVVSWLFAKRVAPRPEQIFE